MRDSVIIAERDSLVSLLFGDESHFVALGEGVEIDVIADRGGDLGYESMVIVVILLYIYWLGRYVSIHTTNRYRESRQKGIGGLKGSSSFLFDTTLPWGLFISLATITILKFCDLCEFETITPLRFGHLMGGVVTGFTLYWLWGWAVMSMWGSDDISEDLRERLVSFKVRTVLQCAIYLLPLSLLSAFAPTHSLLTYLLLATTLCTTIYYFVKTFFLFVREKVSSLRWFLYLCTVEVAPLVLVWLIFDYLTTK